MGVDRGLLASLGAAFAGLAVLVGHDGQPTWQLVRVLVVVALGTGTILLAARASSVGAGAVGVVVGAIAVAVGLGLTPHVAKDGVSLLAAVALVELVAGAVLVALGAARSTRPLRRWARLLTVVGIVAATALVALVVAPAVAATNVPGVGVGATPGDLAFDHEAVRITTGDGVELAAWYLPSRTGAAVVLLHGAGSTRSSVLDEAAVLARGGYGVLLVDARGHGESGGRAMDFGWYGDEDVEAATSFLATRPDVDPERIGLVGLSMGGEEAIGASATDDRVRAVVAEGATARTAGDEDWLSDRFGVRGAFQEQLEKAQDVVTDLLTDADVPVSLHDAIERSGDVRYLLVAAGTVDAEVEASAHLASAATDRVSVWVVDAAGHTEGLATAPGEWARRVVGFLDDALAPAQAR